MALKSKLREDRVVRANTSHCILLGLRIQLLLRKKEQKILPDLLKVYKMRNLLAKEAKNKRKKINRMEANSPTSLFPT
jgi:hypothetical protein